MIVSHYYCSCCHRLLSSDDLVCYVSDDSYADFNLCRSCAEVLYA